MNKPLRIQDFDPYRPTSETAGKSSYLHLHYQNYSDSFDIADKAFNAKDNLRAVRSSVLSSSPISAKSLEIAEGAIKRQSELNVENALRSLASDFSKIND